VHEPRQARIAGQAYVRLIRKITIFGWHMLTLDLERIKTLQIDHFSNNTIPYKSVHPWRLDWRYTVLHAYRVERYAIEIINSDYLNISDKSKTLIRAACLIHDIGKSKSKENHAHDGGVIIQEWINVGKLPFLSKDEEHDLLYYITHHSNKKQRELASIPLNILIDADYLDEIGMMSLIMRSNWIPKEDPYYFKKYLDAIEEEEIEYCEAGMNHLYSKAAKEILSKKMKFMISAKDQLKEELFDIDQI